MDIHLQTTTNIQEKSSLIWGIADLIRDYYKPHEYGKVIFSRNAITNCINSFKQKTRD